MLSVGDRRSIFVRMGGPLDASYRLDIDGRGALEQDGTSFVWTTRRCGRATEGYRFVTVRAVAPGQATVTQPLGGVRELQVSVVE